MQIEGGDAKNEMMNHFFDQFAAPLFMADLVILNKAAKIPGIPANLLLVYDLPI